MSSVHCRISWNVFFFEARISHHTRPKKCSFNICPERDSNSGTLGCSSGVLSTEPSGTAVLGVTSGKLIMKWIEYQWRTFKLKLFSSLESIVWSTNQIFIGLLQQYLYTEAFKRAFIFPWSSWIIMDWHLARNILVCVIISVYLLL